ncbi:uncharacterized protein BYT42DRAFT_209423 [Radiomyces spectabilis]|uniref:uncharacterized protein n=1 Tax=Radiomyces spectabilis TaxID=64574 RepID=UPI002220B254|nr:uncharacterized protein BYT42DRAFT_209423 [Radiomyces spectabilis]KAI8391802.1 hypothetical protein BYT42DRAFT_209423 [Radiomyces spectabilis]
MKPFVLISAVATLLCFQDAMAQQEGGTIPVPTTSTASSYSCDPSTCTLANGCLCASKQPPNNMTPADTPQFVTITYDDSIQAELLKTARKLLNVTNPNGCPARGTWFVSMQYTDFSLVQEWYSQGNEIADHTFTHVGTPSEQEISSCKTMLNTYGGIPNGKVRGFRAPFLNYTKDTLGLLHKQGFLYDSSASAVSEDVFWPYTLDNGMANDCWTGICTAGEVKLPGLWEVPMYAVLDNGSIPQLMDVYMAGQPEDVAKWSMDAFNRHYHGGRQPFGIYVHPTHLTGYPGLDDPAPKLNGLVNFIKSLADKPDVWFVTNQQLLQWMMNPVKASELAKQDYMKCQQPVIAKEICNGLDDDNNGQIDDNLYNSCNFGTTTFKTCFNCPGSAPTLDNPTPASSVQNGTAGYRWPLPNNCDTKWWDPIDNVCLCSSTDCQYKDTAVPTNRTLNGGVNANQAGGSNDVAALTLQPFHLLSGLLIAAIMTYPIASF